MAQTIPKTINVKRGANDMADWKNSGLTQKEWCQLHQVNLHTFKYHLKQVRAAIAAHQAETAQHVSQSPESSALTTQFAKVPLTALSKPDQTQQGMNRQAVQTAVRCCIALLKRPRPIS